MFGKKLSEIDKAEIEELVSAEEAESVRLDFKKKLVGINKGERDARVDFLNDVVAFSNSQGGFIIYGVAEAECRACSCDGYEEKRNEEALQNTLDQIVRREIDPPIRGVRVRKIEGFKNGAVVVLAIRKSPDLPHMVKNQNGTNAQFYVRSGPQNQQVGVHELRSLFISGHDHSERVARFRNQRIGQLVSGLQLPRMKSSQLLVVQLLPTAAMSDATSLHVGDLAGRALEIMYTQDGWGDGAHRFNADGFMTYAYLKDNEVSYRCQVLRNGAIEFVRSIDWNEGKDLMFSDEVVVDPVLHYYEKLQRLGVAPPFVVMATFLGFRGLSFNHPKSKQIELDELFLPEVVIDAGNSDAQIEENLRPALDYLWQASGVSASPCFDKDGSLRRG